MKKILTTALALFISSTLISQTSATGTFKANSNSTNTMTYEQKISYIIGYDIGRNVQQTPFKFDLDAIHKGMKVAFSKDPSEFSEQEMQQIMQEWQTKMQSEQQERANAEVNQHKFEGQAFLEKNKQDKDVKVTESGLQYKVVKMGNGAKPVSTADSSDRVTVHYEGKLLNGTVFDSSYDRGEPISFRLNEVIAGWTEGLQLMPIGSKFMFYIPSDLAYGDRAVSVIPAGSTLVFTVELFGINE